MLVEVSPITPFRGTEVIKTGSHLHEDLAEACRKKKPKGWDAREEDSGDKCRSFSPACVMRLHHGVYKDFSTQSVGRL